MVQESNDNSIVIYSLSEENQSREYPYIGTIPAGFPSPAADFAFETLDIFGKYLKNPEAIFIGKAYGISMDGFISDGDYFYMDKSLRMDYKNGDIAVCAVNGEFTLKKIKLTPTGIDLVPMNEKFPIISVSRDDNFTIWAIVVLIIKPTPTRCLR